MVVKILEDHQAYNQHLSAYWIWINRHVDHLHKKSDSIKVIIVGRIMIDTGIQPEQDSNKFAARNPEDVLNDLGVGAAEDTNKADTAHAHPEAGAAPDANRVSGEEFRASLRTRTDKFLTDQAHDEAAYNAEQAVT